MAAAVLPDHMRELECACAQKHWQDVQERIAPLEALFNALALEPYPATVKYALEDCLECGGQVRLPMVTASPAAKTAIAIAMEAFERPN